MKRRRVIDLEANAVADERGLSCAELVMTADDGEEMGVTLTPAQASAIADAMIRALELHEQRAKRRERRDESELRCQCPRCVAERAELN